MSRRGQVGGDVVDPAVCDEFGYGLGKPYGILVLRYRSSSALGFGEGREDLLHQFYWSPSGMLAARYGVSTVFVGPGEAFWAQRAMTHEVRAGARQTVYRVCLREIPAGLVGFRVGMAAFAPGAAALLESIARSDCPPEEGLAARPAIMGGLSPVSAGVGGAGAGGGYALAVARALTRDPADPTTLEEWAGRLHISPKTLQRDFQREYGTSYSRWRTELRLQASTVLLRSYSVGEVARRVGYASTSAFVAAFGRAFGVTPGGGRLRG
ncbi:helix-turn-helix transcriptional regulator [Cryptosporangium aurantiacum]|uniref:Transcriptional regulator, AraC family n=1 Tax=Cryptosporangium aurantiacum TaxID=134849 RepID=A0A1M7RN07_9ACTN|nr:AraC family transcriptional regulator [Cryptosporangium aurantiacum]SHN47488.1 transcriptional regulator, AraC family [Cryptosporangium aurantiacum]